jgi:hypothetical protein
LPVRSVVRRSPTATTNVVIRGATLKTHCPLVDAAAASGNPGPEIRRGSGIGGRPSAFPLPHVAVAQDILVLLEIRLERDGEPKCFDTTRQAPVELADLDAHLPGVSLLDQLRLDPLRSAGPAISDHSFARRSLVSQSRASGSTRLSVASAETPKV